MKATISVDNDEYTKLKEDRIRLTNELNSLQVELTKLTNSKGVLIVKEIKDDKEYEYMKTDKDVISELVKENQNLRAKLSSYSTIDADFEILKNTVLKLIDDNNKLKDAMIKMTDDVNKLRKLEKRWWYNILVKR